MTLTPCEASLLQASVRPSSKNCASSMPTTSTFPAISSSVCDDSTGVERSECPSCDTTSSFE